MPADKSRTRAIANEERAKVTYGNWFGRIPQPQKRVFLVGCYNPGTTLLLQLLDSQTSIGSPPTKGQFLTDQLATPREVGLSRLWALELDRSASTKRVARAQTWIV